MAAISAKMVSELREKTGAGMMDCKKALVECNGDQQAAIDYLRKKGQKIAMKRADREATEGCVISKATEDHKFAAVIMLNCETDFVGANADFVGTTKQLLDFAVENRIKDIEALNAATINGMTLEAIVTDLTAKTGEKVQVGKYFAIEARHKESTDRAAAEVLPNCRGEMRSCYKLYRVMAFSFDNLPINPLVGADSATFDRVTSGVEIDHLARFRATKICQRVLNPLYQVNNRIYDRANLQKIVSPLFILGHWRSGTTLLHNLLAEDAQFCYCTTYQTIFPHLMIRGSSVMRHLAALAMPHSRPKDHQILSISQPQEEEFAIANTTTSRAERTVPTPTVRANFGTLFTSLSKKREFTMIVSYVRLLILVRDTSEEKGSLNAR